MSKNAIHNFNLSIKNSADIKSSEQLTEAIIKELAKVSKEINQQKDIEQIWQEQKTLNAAAIANNSSTSIEEGTFNTVAEKSEKQQVSAGITSSVSEGAISNPIVSTGEGTNSVQKLVGITSSVAETTSNSSASIGEGVADNTGSTIISSPALANTTSPTLGAGNSALSFSNSTTTQTYGNVAAQQTLTVPQMLQANSEEPTLEAVKAAIKKKLDVAIIANDSVAIAYWTSVSKAFDEGATVQDFDGKADNILFTEMYALLKQLSLPVKSQNFNWDIVRKKMVESIETNILKGKISKESKIRWKLIQKQLNDDTVNVANLFERYDELFLLLKEVEGLDLLPSTITITTKTKIYPNLSADKVYASIGKNDVYIFLKNVSNKKEPGSGVNKGALKIRNTESASFIVGESLEFFLDESFINQSVNKKENIDWIIYEINTKKKVDFVNEGISLSYNFDTAGTYRVEAFGRNTTVLGSKNGKTSTFIELNIVAQEIMITPPAIITGKFARAFIKEEIFKIALKDSIVKTLNPLKLYYQLETTNANKETKTSDLQELDSTGIVKLAMPDLNRYKIRVISNDQYALVKEFEVKIINNFVDAIEITKESIQRDNVYLYNLINQKAIFKAKTFKIEPAAPQEKANLKWLVYDKNGKPYIPEKFKLQKENNQEGKEYLVKGTSFDFPIPKQEGDYFIEAYSNNQDGYRSQSASVKKITVRQPQVTEAYWTYADGNKKKTSGFTGEVNHIKAIIPGYSNQQVRIKVFLNDSKVVNYYNDTITNENGEINKILKFDSALQKHFGIQNGKMAEIRFEFEGIQNGTPYPFKKNANGYNEAILNVKTKSLITDVYFMYEGNRVNVFTQVPYGAKVTGIVKTLNMIGKEVVLKVFKKNAIHSQLKEKTIVNNEGTASISFVLNKKWHEMNPLMTMGEMFYFGMEGAPSKLSFENGLNAVVGNVIKPAEENKETINEDDPQLIWGSKVSKEFRIKVVKIAKKLKVDPNWIMIIIAKETTLTFDPHIDNGMGYVGLIQFSEISAGEVGTTQAELKKMTAETQLNYVEKRFDKLGKNGYKSLTDLYLAVLNPASVGLGDKDSNVLWTSKRMAYYNNASYHKEKGEYDHKIIKKGKTKRGFEEGTTYMWEVREELEKIKKQGHEFEKILKALPLKNKYKNWTLNEITSGYGKRSVQVGSSFHKGLDFNYSGGGDTDIGAPVFSTHDGFIYNLKDDASGNTGRFVVIRSKDNSFQTRYLHLSKIFIEQDQKIKKGQKIGELGASYNGKEKGGDINAHLHYEIMTLEKKGKENVYNQIDPTEGHGKNKAYVIDPQDWIK